MSTSSFSLTVQELRSGIVHDGIRVRWYMSIKDLKDFLPYPSRLQELYLGTSAVPLKNTTTLHDLGIEKDGHVLRLALIGGGCGGGGGGGAAASATSTPAKATPTQLISTPTMTMTAIDKDKKEDEEVVAMMADVKSGIALNKYPVKTDVLDCSGGVYFMRNSAGQKCAVFKPSDEEQGMPNNYKGYSSGFGLRAACTPGNGCLRECAAYLMDVNHFASVPPTSLVHLEHPSFSYPRSRISGKTSTTFPKLGSLQSFVQSDAQFEDIGHSLFSDFEVQKIALFDMRILNCDRNASNILVKRKIPQPSSSSSGESSSNGNSPCPSPMRVFKARSASISSVSSDDIFEYESGVAGGRMFGAPSGGDGEDFLGTDRGVGARSPSFSFFMGAHAGKQQHNRDQFSLIPIDHGYCMPTTLSIGEWDWAWFNLPHVKRAVHPEIRNYMLSLDFDVIASKLSTELAFPEESLFLLRLSHHLIVGGIKAGLSLHEIASLMVRVEEDQPSALERAATEAEDNAYRAIEMRSGRQQAPLALKVKNDLPRPSVIVTVNNELVIQTTSLDEGEGATTSATGSPTSLSGFVSSSSEGASFSPPTERNKPNSLMTGIFGNVLNGEALRSIRSLDQPLPAHGLSLLDPTSPKSSPSLRSRVMSEKLPPPALSFSFSPSSKQNDPQQQLCVSPLGSSKLIRSVASEEFDVIGNITIPPTNRRSPSSSSSSSSVSSSGKRHVRRTHRHERLFSSSSPKNNNCAAEDADAELTIDSKTGRPVDTGESRSSSSCSSNNNSSNSDGSSSNSDTEKPTEEEKKQLLPHKQQPSSKTKQSKQRVGAPITLARVSSFSAFNSAPIYDVDLTNERRLSKLHREKRRSNAHALQPAAFLALKTQFAEERIAVLLSQHARKLSF